MKLNSDLLIMTAFIASFNLLPSLWFFYKAYFMNKERKLIFDRKRGLIQVPGSYNEPSQLLRFSEAHFVIAMLTRFQGGVFLFLCKNKTFADKYLGQGIMTPFFSGKVWQSWSYFVWYMDRNRPLPPGDALDPYRPRDYERRKSEGFPAHLYPSAIETPEHFTNEYHLMNETNKMIPGRYNISLNDEQGKKNSPDHSAYYNSL